MIFYFTDWTGEHSHQGDHPKGWFDPLNKYPDVFTSRRKRDKARQKRLRARIAGLKQELKEVGKYD